MYNSASGVINSLRSWHISCTIGHLTKLYFTKILSSDNFKIMNKSVFPIGAENSTVTRIYSPNVSTTPNCRQCLTMLEPRYFVLLTYVLFLTCKPRHGRSSFYSVLLLLLVWPYGSHQYVITLTSYLRHSQYRSRLFQSLLSRHTKFCGKSSESKQIIRSDQV